MSTEPPFPPLTWRGGFHPLFLFLCGVIVATNWIVPANLIESSPMAMAYAEYVRQALLHVSPYADIWAHARTTLFPQAAMFSHALTWTAVLLVTVYDFVSVACNWRRWTRFWRATVWAPAPRKTRLIVATFGLFTLVVIWAVTMMPGSSTYTASADLHSRVVLGLLSGMVLTLWHLMAFSQATMLFAVFDRLFLKDQS